jgi:hypothetical protein
MMARLRLSPNSDAAQLAYALDGKRCGHGWKAKCPAHDDRDPSLSISVSREGKTLIHCHAGCSQADVLSALKARDLWPKDAQQHLRPRLQSVHGYSERDDAARKASALDIWNKSIPASGTLAEDYLRSRGITLPIPDAIRFHDNLTHHSSSTAWPAMVALIVDVEGGPMAVHRTYLARDGKGKAPVEPSKMALGPCRHGAVRLAHIEHDKALIVAEGIETAMSVMQACGLPAFAALSADGMKNVRLPDEAKTVILAADNDVNGVGQAAAETARKRLTREGRKVRTVMPPDVGSDFNDVLRKSNESVCHV